ncbi:MAG: hypothetical protein ACJ76H_13965 [Bacteriovoracaceae bacterium]
MKIWVVFLLILALPAFASAECEDYEFQGMVRLHDKAFFIHIHEGTLSEMQIPIPKSEELKFLPYHEELASGKFESGTFTNLDFAIPDGEQFLRKKENCK